MSIFDKQRKSMPIPSGLIPYWESRCVNGVVYSIDKCRLRFPLRWGQLRLICGDELLLPTDQNMIKAAALRINADCDMFMMFLCIISVVVNQFVYMRLHKNIYKKRAKVINI